MFKIIDANNLTMNQSSIFCTCICGFINVNVILYVKLRLPNLSFYSEKILKKYKYESLFCNYDSLIIQADEEKRDLIK